MRDALPVAAVLISLIIVIADCMAVVTALSKLRSRLICEFRIFHHARVPPVRDASAAAAAAALISLCSSSRLIYVSFITHEFLQCATRPPPLLLLP